VVSNPYQYSEVATDSQIDCRASTIVKYWEKKRILFNVLLLLAGSIPLITFPVIPGTNLKQFLVGGLIYGIFANIFYSLGPYFNVWYIVYLNRQVIIFKWLFYLGLLFSIALTVLISFSFVFFIE